MVFRMILLMLVSKYSNIYKFHHIAEQLSWIIQINKEIKYESFASQFYKCFHLQVTLLKFGERAESVNTFVYLIRFKIDKINKNLIVTNAMEVKLYDIK